MYKNLINRQIGVIGCPTVSKSDRGLPHHTTLHRKHNAQQGNLQGGSYTRHHGRYREGRVERDGTTTTLSEVRYTPMLTLRGLWHPTYGMMALFVCRSLFPESESCTGPFWGNAPRVLLQVLLVTFFRFVTMENTKFHRQDWQRDTRSTLT